MTNVILCQGAYSKTPYYLKDDCRNVYCIEELCYYLYHNAYLLDDSFVCDELGEWVEKSLMLEKTGKEIKRLCGRYGALSKLIQLLKNDIGFYSDKEWDVLLGNINENIDMSIEQRRKIRADGFLATKKYGLAMDEYEHILQTANIKEVTLRAKVFHNMGVCAANLFMFEKAAGYFERAYDTYANTESYVSMLASMKMYMRSEDYLSYLSSHKESYEDSLEVERKFDRLSDNWQHDPTYLFIKEMEDKKNRGSEFYKEMDALTEEVKSEYRDQVFRGRTGGF